MLTIWSIFRKKYHICCCKGITSNLFDCDFRVFASTWSRFCFCCVLEQEMADHKRNSYSFKLQLKCIVLHIRCDYANLIWSIYIHQCPNFQTQQPSRTYHYVQRYRCVIQFFSWSEETRHILCSSEQGDPDSNSDVFLYIF